MNATSPATVALATYRAAYAACMGPDWTSAKADACAAALAAVEQVGVAYRDICATRREVDAEVKSAKARAAKPAPKLAAASKPSRRCPSCGHACVAQCSRCGWSI